MARLVVSRSRPSEGREYPLVKASEIATQLGAVAGPRRPGGSEHPAKCSVTTRSTGGARVMSMRVKVGSSVYTAKFDHSGNLVSMKNPKGDLFPTRRHLVKVPEGTIRFKAHVSNVC